MGDADGDGYDDFLVGAYKSDLTARGEIAADAGSAYLFSGAGVRSGAAEDQAVARFFGEGRNDKFGYRVHGAGDLDGDGRGDALIGAPFSNASAPNGGAAYVYLSPLEGAPAPAGRIEGGGAGDALGVSVAGVGDLDGDGAADVAVGAFGVDERRGAVYLFGGFGL